MIIPKSRSLEWITEAARQMGVRDIALVEKTIRAFSLLEALASKLGVTEFAPTCAYCYEFIKLNTSAHGEDIFAKTMADGRQMKIKKRK
jgi:hypothetical protein